MKDLNENNVTGKSILERIQAEYGDKTFIPFFTAIINRADTVKDIVRISEECGISLKSNEPKVLMEFVETHRHMLDPNAK